MFLCLKYHMIDVKDAEWIKDECMKIDIKTSFAVAIFMFLVCSTNSAFSTCSKDENAVVTGAACSISELNKLESVDDSKINSQIKSGKERNLRPVKSHLEITNIEESGCFWGQCLVKQIFGK